MDDGILVGTPSALSSFLDVLQHQGPSYGLHPNLSKCEVFWPSHDQSVVDFPPAVKRLVLHEVGGIDFLGSPIWGSPDFLSTFVGSVVDRISVLQACLEDLEDPQVELLLLHSCLGVCKLNHLLRTIPPGSMDSELLRFDDNLRRSLSSICVMPLFLLAPGYSALFAWWLNWACMRHLRLLQQPFWVVVLVLLPFAFSFCLPFRGILLPCLLFLVRSLLSLICLLHFLVLRYQWCLPLSCLRLNGYFNLSLMLVSPILCCPLAHFVIKLGFVPSLYTLVPVHGSGPFLQFLWALPCPGRSLCVLFGTGLKFQFFLLPILFAAPVAARSQ